MLAPVAYLFGRSAASAGFCAVMAFWASCADAQLRLPGEGGDVLIQPPGHKVQVIGTAAPDPGEKIAFEAFASKTLYYGALYIDVTAADLAYYVDNFHTLAAAKTVAKAACESGAEAASHCEIYAIVTPSADKALEDGAQTLSESAARTFLDSFLALEKTSMLIEFHQWHCLLMVDSQALGYHIRTVIITLNCLTSTFATADHAGKIINMNRKWLTSTFTYTPPTKTPYHLLVINLQSYHQIKLTVIICERQAKTTCLLHCTRVAIQKNALLRV